MTSDLQYWCYINNSEEFEYIKSLPKVDYINNHLKHSPEFPIAFHLDLRGIYWTPFWVLKADSSLSRHPELYPELPFEEMKAQIFIYQLTL